jgi:hypothetical protein
VIFGARAGLFRNYPRAGCIDKNWRRPREGKRQNERDIAPLELVKKIMKLM